MIRVLKSIIHLIGLRYECYKIYQFELTSPEQNYLLEHQYRCAEVTQKDVSEARDEIIRETAWYGGGESFGFGVYKGEDLVCVQWVWFGSKYATKRNFWPLGSDEVKSVNLVTCESERGKGLATALKGYSSSCLAQKGFKRIYSRIWWSNRSSIRVSEKLGWQHVATVLHVQWRKHGSPYKFVFGRNK